MSYKFDRLQVLVIDDNQHMRTLMGVVLQAYGVKTVFEARDADQAWRIFAKNPCDIIFVDWAMAGMTGLEFTRKVRTAPDSADPFAAIVMLTGHTSIERMNAARDAGANEFLAKPVSSQTILERLISVIDNPRPFVRTRNYFGPCRRRGDIPFAGWERRAQEAALLFAPRRSHMERERGHSGQETKSESNGSPANVA
jgi:CheY-like chemotaxis protein